MLYTELRNGLKMPMLGYGVYQIKKEDCERCVTDALKTGYRLIDTAQCYFNESETGAAIAKSGIPRSEIFLTTKLWLEHYGYEKCKSAVMRSLDRLKTDYLDLMLLHQPYCDVYGAWRAFEELYEKGILRAIGVSNFYPDRLVDICSFAEIPPMVNQTEIHPRFRRDDVLEWNKKYGVVTEAWAPLGQGKNMLTENGLLIDTGKKYGKTAAQVMLRWNIQRGAVVIPKSVHKERMKENLDVFDFTLSDGDMKSIGTLDMQETVFGSHYSPKKVEWFAEAVEARKGLT